jgi:hypothetical protein
VHWLQRQVEPEQLAAEQSAIWRSQLQSTRQPLASLAFGRMAPAGMLVLSLLSMSVKA